MAARSPGRLAVSLSAALALACLASEAMAASSRICRQLEAELASGGRGGGSAAQLHKQDAAIARQQDQLQQAKRQARRSGCAFKLFGSPDSCSAIAVKIEDLKRDIEAMQRRRARSADAGSGRSRAQVIAALRANGCRDEAVAERRPLVGSDGSRSLLEQIFGGGIRHRASIDELGEPLVRRDGAARRISDDLQGGWINDGGHIRYSAPPGAYRTLCVRTCDGYFFPMSGASSPLDFERDQANCQSSCPGTEVQIYYHREGQESDAMVSGVSGQPYADLPAAWLYKQTGTPSPAGCACGVARNDGPKNFSVVAGNPPAPPVQSESDGAPAAEALGRTAVAPKANKPAAAGEERKVRVVGPAFLPAPEAAADPQAPDPTPVR